jgi:hypothetical protein
MVSSHGPWAGLCSVIWLISPPPSGRALAGMDGVVAIVAAARHRTRS